MATAGTRAELGEMAAALSGCALGERNPYDVMCFDEKVHRLIYRAANPHLKDALIRYDNPATRIWSLVLEKVS